MNKILFIGLLVFLGFEGFGQNSNRKIVSMTAISKRISCNTNGTDYTIGIAVGYGSLSNVKGKSISNAKKQLSNYVGLKTFSNFNENGDYKGNYSVIIKTKGKKCPMIKYGIGFGKNKSEALKEAIWWAGIRNPYWIKSYGYEMVSSERID